MEILENEPNYIIIQENQNKTLYSYTQKIATITNNKVIDEIDKNGNLWKNYSATTKKHYNKFIKNYL